MCLDNWDRSVAKKVADLSCIRVIETNQRKTKKRQAKSKQERFQVCFFITCCRRPIKRVWEQQEILECPLVRGLSCLSLISSLYVISRYQPEYDSSPPLLLKYLLPPQLDARSALIHFFDKLLGLGFFSGASVSGIMSQNGLVCAPRRV